MSGVKKKVSDQDPDYAEVSGPSNGSMSGAGGGVKRPAPDQDPDYEAVRPHQEKRQRLFEEGAKEMTVRRIETIIRRQFSQEKQNKEAEIMLIDERLSQARMMADRLRACIVASFYSRAGQPLAPGKAGSSSALHPTVKRHMGKAPRESARNQTQPPTVKLEKNGEDSQSNTLIQKDHNPTANKTVPEIKKEVEVPSSGQKEGAGEGHTSRFKIKKRIIVGNLSKYIPVDKRESSDRSTHRWMVYVRGPTDKPHIDDFVEKVWFFLHPSYRPHDLVEITERPFHLTRRGWGEFPVRVQLHFKDKRNKRVDILHQLKLDRTYTGLQTLGSETVVDIELERDSVGLPVSATPLTPLLSKTTNTTTPATTDNDVTTEGITRPQPEPTVTIKQEKVDLSIVKIEPMDVSETRRSSAEDRMSNEVRSAFSPRPGTVTPVKMVLGGLGQSPARVASPASGTTTPVKEGSGWTRIQIKSEPDSPRASPVGKKGWQNIASLTSPIKTEVQEKSDLSTGNTVVISPEQKQVTSPAKLIMTPGGGILHVAQPVIGQGQGKISLVTGQTTPSSQPITIVSQSPGSILRTTASPSAPGQVLNMSPVGGTLVATPGNVTPRQQQQQQQSQPTVYIRCSDNSGKVYLIPQHVLSKTSPAATLPQPRPTLQRVSTPLGMAILPPGGTLPAAVGHGAMGAVQALATMAATQRSNKSQAAAAAAKAYSKQVAMTTCTIKNAGKTATLTYVLAAGGALGTQTVSSGSQGQKVVASLQPGKGQVLGTLQPLQGQKVLGSLPQGHGQKVVGTLQASQGQKVVGTLQPGQGQSLVLASPLGQGQGQSLILTSQAGQRSQPGTPLSTATSKQANSQLSTPVKVTPSRTEVNKSLLMSPALTENVRIVGGNIVSGSKKSPNIVLINQPAIAAGSTSQAKVATPPGGISLLTGLTGVRAARPKTTVVTQPPQRSPVTGVSLLNPRQPSPIIVKQEPRLQQPKPHAPSATLVPASHPGQPQILLVPAAPATSLATPTVTMATGKKTQPAPATQSSLLTTIGNHKVIVQLLPQQAVVAGSQTVGNKSSSVRLPGGPSEAKPATGGGDGINGQLKKPDQSVFHKVHPPKAVEKPIHLCRYSRMEDLVRVLVRTHPVVKEGVDRAVHPYCADSEQTFLNWPLGKQRAAEWCRAATVQRRIRAALDDGGDGVGCQGDGVRFHGEAVWSKKRIVWWCRNHSYTPWNKGLQRLLKKTSTIEDGLESSDLVNGDLEKGDLTTLSDPWPLIEELTQKQTERSVGAGEQTLSDEEEVDIISCEVISRGRIKQESPQKVCRTEPQVCLPPSPAATFVRNAASQIGVCTKPVEVDSDQAPGVYVHAVEDMIMAVTKSLMEDVVRKARSLLLERFTCPDELRVHHIMSALKTIPVCDVLTNAGMGVLSDAGTAEDIKPTTHPPA